MFIKDFDSWNRLKKKLDASAPSTPFREGEIRWCKFGLNIGNETLGKGSEFKRPVLILKKFSTDVFLGLPLTSQIRQGSWFYPINNKGIKNSILLNQARVLDRKRLEQKILTLSDKELQEIKNAFTRLIRD